MAIEPISQIEAAVLPLTQIKVKEMDGAEVIYSLCLDYNAIIKAEKEIGRDLSVRKNWVDLSKADLTALAWAALDRFHPTVTLHTLRQQLGPAQQGQLWVMLIEQAQPGILKEIEEAVAESQRRKLQGVSESGESPNVAAAA